MFFICLENTSAKRNLENLKPESTTYYLYKFQTRLADGQFPINH